MASENIFQKIIFAAQAERERRARRFPVSDALLEKAVNYRIRHGIRLPYFLKQEK